MLPAFFFWLATNAIGGIILVMIGWHSPLYPRIWGIIGIFEIPTSIFAAAEIHRVSARYSGRPGRAPLVAFAIAAGIGVAAAVTYYCYDPLRFAWNLPHVVFMLKRFVSLGLVVFLSLSALFYSEAGLSISPSIRAHRFNAITYFLMVAISYTLIDMVPKWAKHGLGVLPMLGGLVLMLRWASMGRIPKIKLPDASERAKENIRRAVDELSKGPMMWDVSARRAQREASSIR